MEAKQKQSPHTPGSWRTGDMFATVFGPPNGNPCPEVIADVHPLNRKANARLIAAAPELLAALHEFCADVDAVGPEHVAEDWPDLYQTYTKAQDLLLKAAL